MEGLASANVDLYIEEHNENMRRLENALEAERTKQIASIREKMKLRKLKQQRLKTL